MKHLYRPLLLTILALAGSNVFTAQVAVVQANENGADRPNVVIFLSDDQGWGDFSFTGNKDLATPNIDSMARDGAVFERFFVCPVCSPTRAEFLTGRFHARSNVYSTSAGGERMDLNEITIAQLFKRAGYATGAFGKWHNGMQYPYHPNARGFDEYYGFCSGHWGNYHSPMLERNGQIVRGNGFCVDDFTEQAIKFIEKKKEQPFFVYLPYNTPHSPMQVPDKFWKKFAEKEISQPSSNPAKENLQHTRAALAMCENIDWNVGRVLKKLDELELAENTIVMYFNDNGPNGWRWNGGMRGKKGSTDEGGVKTPLIVRWPAKTPAGIRIRALTGAIDLLPTLCKACSVSMDSPNKLDGESFALELKGAKVKRKPRVFYNAWKDKLSVRTSGFRLDHQGKLFDMTGDPNQTKPLNAKHPETVEKLNGLADKFREEVMSLIDTDKIVDFPLGHADFKFTQLPARDAIVTGKLKRSNKFPNCSYFTNWIDTADTISWPVQVLESGEYKVELYYTCAEKNVGAKLQLEMGDSKISTVITEAHDPAEFGAAEDRVKRMESYVKDFKPITMGTINLKKGPGNLVLSTKEMVGGQSIDFRLLFFTRVEK